MVRFPIGFSVCVATKKTLAIRKHEFWDSDRVLLARGLLPHDWSLASELSEKSGCEKATRWLDSLSVPLCALRPKNPGHQQTRIWGIQTVFCSVVGCCHTIGHLRANFPRSQDVRKPPDYRFLCVRCDQRTLATRKHEFWDTDLVLFARGLLPHDWSLASELSEKSGCEKTTTTRWFDSQSVSLCALRPKKPWPSGNTNFGIQTVFCWPVGCCHTIGHLRANFPRSQDVRKPPDGSIPYRFLCVRCDQITLATRKHEFLDTDRVLIARGLLPHDWSLASELSEKSGCEKATRRFDSLSVPLCALRPKSPGHQETRFLGYRPCLVRPWVAATRLVTCERTFREVRM